MTFSSQAIMSKNLDQITEAIKNQQNIFQLEGGGHTLWSGLLEEGSPQVVVDQIDFAFVTVIWNEINSGQWSSFSQGLEVDQLQLFNIFGKIELNTNKQLVLSSTNAAFDYNVWMAFISSPFKGVGQIGPQGPVGAGTLSGTWQPLSYGSGWSDFDSVTFHEGSYREDSDGRVLLRGITTSTDWSGQATIATLPITFSKDQRVLATGNGNTPVKLEVLANGNINVISGGANNGWLSLENLRVIK